MKGIEFAPVNLQQKPLPFQEQLQIIIVRLPCGTKPTTEFLKTPQGEDLIRRIAHHLYLKRGGGKSTEEQKLDDINKATTLATDGLNRQLIRRYYNNLPFTFEASSKILA
ncbi:MAG: hypothetical protein UR52_C0002G0007 [Candidatus Gottesmanbacteria bacterium GW2011_GWA1_34_13]|uniref:Uncharacterized protein n=1 Tax=Candidatus Gottesmanbacteria bacterium GW2011_GWA1_34_13 TaxID=1618434 RepID=A0A0G0ASB8_9BACT|nr:MAG: hypothetical protein UR52_C0002G0007 [Candidatus Gottesmanbacteria bacterium GW2011_GWA1_34_13]